MTEATDVRLHVMGDVTLRIDGATVSIRGAKKHRLLSRLALTPTEAVSADGLIDALWGHEAPRTAKQSLHVHISHIRDRLRPHHAEHLIETTSDGRYRLGIDADNLDATVFAALATEGLGAARSGNHRHARDVLADALELWADPFVALEDLAGAIAERQRLVTLHERAADALAASLIELREIDVALPLLRAEVAEGSLRERPYEMLMRVYLEQGESGLAVAVHDELAANLDRALGITPSRELQRLRRQAIDGNGHITARARRQRADVDVTTSTLIKITSGSDSRGLIDGIVEAAAAQHRRVAHGRLGANGDVSPLSPIVELAGVDAQDIGAGIRQHRIGFYHRLTDSLVRNFGVGPVVVLEELELGSPQLLDYLQVALTKPGPAPFTLIATYVADQTDPSTIATLTTVCDDHVAIELPATVDIVDVASVTVDEQDILATLACATLPIPAEVLVQASGVAVADAAAAIERLSVRGLVISEVAGGLSVREPDRLRRALALCDDDRRAQHLALVEALDRSTTTTVGYRLVAEARHRLSALPSGDHEAAWQAALGAARSLGQLGAYRDVVELLERGRSVLNEAPPSPTTLELNVELGRAQIRAGKSDAGLGTLGEAVGDARRLGHPELLAEAVRAMLEERAPQRLDDDTRSLIVEALDGLPDETSDTSVQLMTDLANSWYLLDQQRSETLALEAVQIASAAQADTKARALTGLLQACLRPDNARERLELCVEAQRHARRSESTESLVLALTYEACALMELGHPRRAMPPLRYAEALAGDLQVPRYQWWAAAWSALVEFALGGVDEAEDRFHAAYRLWPTSTRADPFECFAAQLAAVRFLQGRGGELLPALANMAVGDNIGFLAPLALAQAQAGYAESPDTIERLLEALRHCRDITMPYGLALGAEAAWHIGHQEAGDRLAEMIAPLAHVYTTLNVWGGGGFYWGSLRHAHGLSLGLAGHDAEARAALSQAAGDQAAAGMAVFADRSERAIASL